MTARNLVVIGQGAAGLSAALAAAQEARRRGQAVNVTLLEKAAELKATQLLSLADAWIAACALLHDATLVHKDPELVPLACEQLVLPFRG